jgi:hypothetical protein
MNSECNCMGEIEYCLHEGSVTLFLCGDSETCQGSYSLNTGNSIDNLTQMHGMHTGLNISSHNVYDVTARMLGYVLDTGSFSCQTCLTPGEQTIKQCVNFLPRNYQYCTPDDFFLFYVSTMQILSIQLHWILTKKRPVHYTMLHTSVTDSRLNWTVCLGRKISCMWQLDGQCESQSVARHLLHTTGNF